MKLCNRCNKRPAVIFITRMEGNRSYPEGYCIKCAKELNIPPVNDLLKSMNISEEEFEQMNEEMMQVMEEMVDPESGQVDSQALQEKLDEFIPGGAATFPFLQNLFENQIQNQVEQPDSYVAEAVEKDRPKQEQKNKKKKFKFLDGYCTNLTERAKNGQIDRVIGREKELYRVIQIMSRRSKNNPCLIGEPGVGKTAIAEGLALKIAAGDVPAKLLHKQIYLLDLTALVAGTQFRGQFESRVKGLIEEIKSDGNIILFIDEVHNLVGTGDSEGTMSAANILKPALSRGEIQVIGATTFNEYRKYIERDAALERRFQPVTVEEPSIEDTFQMLKGVKDYYEKHHNVTVSDGILHQAVVLSERYINDRYMPDKAIDLLDEACACAALRNKTANDFLKLQYRANDLHTELATVESADPIDYEQVANIKAQIAKIDEDTAKITPDDIHTDVTFEDLARVIQLWTGIPASKIQESDLKKLSGLEDALHKRIIGQDEAISVIAAAVKRSRVQINKKRRPASFILSARPASVKPSL